MGAKASTPSAGSESTLPHSHGSNARARTLSTSAGTSRAESSLGFLHSTSHDASNLGINVHSIGLNGNSNHNGSQRVVGDRGRTRSLSSVPGSNNGTSRSIPTLLSQTAASHGGGGSSGTEGSTPDEYSTETSFSNLGLGRVFATHSLPAHLWSLNGFKCPVCNKLVLADDLECHLVICLTRPRISYNEDVLTELKGECVICLDDLNEGDTIARLPCLCIYHKSCIDEWFQVNRSCPEHPYD